MPVDPLNPAHVDPMLLARLGLAAAVLAPAYLAWALASLGWQRLRWWLWWRRM